MTTRKLNEEATKKSWSVIRNVRVLLSVIRKVKTVESIVGKIRTEVGSLGCLVQSAWVINSI